MPRAQIVQVQQGSTEWLEHRARSYNASDAAAMLGISSYKSRTELLNEKKTGISPEVDPFTQKRFDRGHELEHKAKPIVERLIGKGDLFPVVLAADVYGLPLAASLDGLTMDETASWENKTLNAKLEESLSDGVIPDEYHPQMEQGLMLSGANRCLFTASVEDPESKTGMRVLEVWYEKNLALRKRIIDGWKQFQSDLESHEYTNKTPTLIAAPVDQFPALTIRAMGSVTESNLTDFASSIRVLIKDKASNELVTDQDFVDADAIGKKFREGAKMVAERKQAMLDGAASIGKAAALMDDLIKEMNSAALSIEKRVKAEKESRKADLIQEFERELVTHFNHCNNRFDQPLIPVDLSQLHGANVIKGLKSIDSMRDKLSSALAQAKIVVNAMADLIAVNLKHIEENDFYTLVPDLPTVCTKPEADFKGMIALRKQQADDAKERTKAEAEEAAKQQTQEIEHQEEGSPVEGSIDEIPQSPEFIAVDPAQPDSEQTMIQFVGTREDFEALHNEFLAQVKLKSRTETQARKHFEMFLDFAF